MRKLIQFIVSFYRMGKGIRSLIAAGIVVAGVATGAHVLFYARAFGNQSMPSQAFLRQYRSSQTMQNKYQMRGNGLDLHTGTAQGDVVTTVGDPTGADFVPNMSISRLNGSAAFSLRPDISNVPSGARSYAFSGNKITFDTPDVQYVMYDTTTPVTPPGGAKKNAPLSYESGYEYEFVLKTKPASNVITSPIQTQGLDFYYQPPLNVEMKSPSCTATDCGTMHRPENVVGSYAVYYSGNKKGDYSALGGENYGTGKAFQIYRPKAIDAAGNWTWCGLHVDPASGQMTITVPQKFLDSASYPVTVDPTFGYTTVGASYDAGSPNTILGSVYAGSAGTLTSVTAQVYPDNGYPFQFAVYNSSLALVGNSAASSGTDSTQNWYTLNVSGTISNANYWLLFNTADTILYFYYDTGATNQGMSLAQTYGTWPASLSSPTYNTRMYSIYATYTAAAGTVVSPSYVASGTFTAGTGSITPPYPAGTVAGEVCLLVVTSENQAISLTTANGFVQVPTWSPQYAGTAAVNPASRLAVYWKRTVGSDAAPVVADSGDNTEGQIHCFSGVTTSGNPWDVGAGGNDGAANTTAGNIPGATTTVKGDLVVLINSTSYNGTSQAQFSGWTNANLTTLTERADNSNTAGLGGGHGMATGIMSTIGNYGTTTVTLANTSYQGAISIALKPAEIITSLGKTSDGWSGAVPVYIAPNTIASSSYPYARAQVVTPASQTFYATTTWNGATNRWEGVIYPGSNYCAGCADPTTGTFTVTAQVSSDPTFGTISYSAGAGTFSTFITRRWNAVSTAAMGNSTDYAATFSGSQWNVTTSDFSLYASTAVANTAVAIPFIPTSSAITITRVTIGGTAISQGSAASTTNAWWWDTNQHALYIQAASMGTSQASPSIVTFSFTSDTDLWATRVDDLATYNIGERQFYNGIMVANQYIYTTIFGGDVVWNATHVNATGEQVELTGHNATTGDVNLDCMERTAAHVDNTILADSTGYYSAIIKWAPEWQNWITEATNDHITMVFHNATTTGTAWQQYTTNGISATRTQTYYSGKHYIKNTYQFTNGSASSHSIPFVWMREQWLGTDRNTNDRGRFPQSVADVTTETSTPISSLSSPWWTTYDTGVFAAQAVIFPEAQTASATAYFLEHPVLTNATPWAQWPVVVTYPTSTSPEASDIVLSRDLGTVAAGSSTSMTFWQWGAADLTNITDITNAISSDASALNPPSTMAQAAYRLFNNANSTDVGTALAAQNTAATLGSTGATFRTRVLANVSGADLALNKQFKLQYAAKGTGTCAAPTGTWTDVSSSTPIAFYDNSVPANGDPLTANANDPTDGSNTIMNQTYVEANPVLNTQSVVLVGQDAKWDFSLKDNSAPGGTTYCLRMIWNSGTLFNSYTAYPEITTASNGTVSCSTSPTSTAFGSLDLTGVKTASPNVTTTLSCTYGAGCTLYINDAGSGSNPGLWSSAASHLIASANSTLAVGTEGYGIQAATTTAGSGALLTLASAYNQTGNTVGGLLLAQTPLASSSASFTSREVAASHKAAIAGTTPAGNYTDTITYSCAGN